MSTSTDSPIRHVVDQKAVRQAHRADIQGLRAVAILLVVLAHSRFPLWEGGFVGVDVFFVISGYLITGVLVRGYLDRRMACALLDFYVKRFKRLLPALSWMLVGTAVAAFVLLTPSEFSEQTSSLRYAAIWLSNVYFAFTEVDYFAELQGKDLFLHTWSLGLEEQFNLLWPLLISLAYGVGVWCRTGVRKALRRMIWALLLTSLAMSVLLSAGEYAPASYYLPHTRFWEFLLGAAVYVHCVDSKERADGLRCSGKKRAWWAAAGLLLIVGSGLAFHDNMAYPGVLALMPCVGAALVLASGQSEARTWAGRFLSSTGMRWLGDRSYSWYLWHWPVLTLGYALGAGTDALQSLALMLLSLIVASASYRWIELPFWKGQLRHLETRRVLLFSFMAMAFPVAVASVLLSVAYVSPAIVATELSAVQAARNDFPWIYSQPCDFSFKSSDLTPCVKGEASASKVVVLIGDSIGAQWVSALSPLVDSGQWKLIVATKSSCPPVDEDVYLRDHKVFEKCLKWRQKVWGHVEALRPDVVILGSAAGYGFNAKQWVEGSSAVLSHLAPLVTRMVVVAGTPSLSFDGPACLERVDAAADSAPGERSCTDVNSRKPWDEVAEYLEQSVARHPSARLLNLNDLVCPRGVCSARAEDGVIVFRDSQHLTDSFVRSRTPEISQRLRAVGLEH